MVCIGGQNIVENVDCDRWFAGLRITYSKKPRDDT